MNILTDNTVPIGQIPALVFPALGDTLIMVGVVMAIVVIVGVPLGSLVHNLAPGGLFENRFWHTTLSWIVSVGRSLPFLILMAAIVPFTRLLTGTNIGIPAAVVPMSIAGIAFFTRIVENSLRAVSPSLTRVARASGASSLQIIRTAQLSEAVPSLIGGLTINTIAMIEYSAIAGTIGAGGIGYVAVTYGYQRFDNGVMLATIIILVALVAAVQLTGDRLVRLTTPHSVRLPFFRNPYRQVVFARDGDAPNTNATDSITTDSGTTRSAAGSATKDPPTLHTATAGIRTPGDRSS